MAAGQRSQRCAALKKLVRRELVEAELLERAAELFAARGFSGTTLQDVADTVGLTRAALYHYFDSKEALLSALVEGITSARVADLRAIASDSSLSHREKLARTTRTMAVNVAAQAVRFRLLLLSESELPDDLAAKHARGRRETLKHIVDLFEAGRAAGEFNVPDPHLAAFALLGMCNWIAMWFKPGQHQTAEHVGDQFADFALAAFGRNGDPDERANGDASEIIARMRVDLISLERISRST